MVLNKPISIKQKAFTFKRGLYRQTSQLESNPGHEKASVMQHSSHAKDMHIHFYIKIVKMHDYLANWMHTAVYCSS